MARSMLRLLLAGCLAHLAFHGVFQALRSEAVYHATLGRVSVNYERSGTWDAPVITTVRKPFTAMDESGLTNWDAGLYSCIARRLYVPEEACHGRTRAAFFPLFPLVWRWTGASAAGMALLNALLFIGSLAFLAVRLMGPGHPRLLATYAVLVAAPSTVIFRIPYTEALFMAAMTVAAWGMLRGRYGLYFAGALLVAMVRPASVIVMVAIVLAGLWAQAGRRSWRSAAGSAVRWALPFALGHVAALTVQRLSSGSWTAFRDAIGHWEGGLRAITGITDWSQEGFGLNVFTLCFVCLPALAAIVAGLRKGPPPAGAPYDPRRHLIAASLLYVAGILLFTVLTSAGNLHSFFRFVLASPFFHILVLAWMARAPGSRPVHGAWPVVVPVVAAAALLTWAPYGGDRLAFPFAGLYLWAAAALFLHAMHRLPRPVVAGGTALLVALGLVWTAYLMNMYLSNGWIFT
ncbi:MAG: hypothetical protein RBT71_12480 [Flavobacteriales bacterium]|jgi:hypothetical protein|nr:hypothetical protein [Flavobacteriales bacterium]